MKKLLHKSLSAVLVLTIVLSLFAGLSFQSAAELPASGSCGDNVTFTFNYTTGLLTISGSGAMNDYGYGKSPFYSQSGIISIIIENGVTNIGNGAFYNCSKLTKVTIPTSVTRIGRESFPFCKALKNITIPDSVTIIDTSAFNRCGLTSIIIPKSVTSIRTSAFLGCYDLMSIQVDSNNQYFDSRNNCNAIIATERKILILGCKKTIIPNTVTSIGESAFSGCDLTSIIIPDSVKSIGSWAFSGCSGMKSITIPKYATYIGPSAFKSCIGLTSFTIPNSVTNIGSEAFSNCSSLKSITIPASVTSIGMAPFSGCSSLTSIQVDSNNQHFDSRNNCNAIIEKETNCLIVGCQNSAIPDSVKTIGYEAFLDCTTLNNIVIPDSITSIQNLAFFGCTGLESIDLKGTNVQIVDSEKVFPFNATLIINGSKNVYEYAAKYSRKYICNHIEEMCSAKEPTCENSGLTEGTHCTICGLLTQTVIPALGHDYETIRISPTFTERGYTINKCSRCDNSYITDYTDIAVTYKLNNDNTITVLKYSGEETEIIIPEKINGYYISAIGQNAFENSELEFITIPESVNYIGEGAFKNCKKLKSVNIYCEEVIVEKYAFYGCSALSNLEFAETNVSIEDEAFAYCSSLVKFSIPYSELSTEISDTAFVGCKGISFNQLYSGSLAGINSIVDDIYILDLPVSGRVYVSLSNAGQYPIAFNIDGNLGGNTKYDSNLNYCKYYYTDSGMKQSPVLAGTRLLKLYSMSNSSSEYSLKVQFESSNESFIETRSEKYDYIGTAKQINLGTEYYGAVGKEDSQDFYRIDLPSGIPVEFSIYLDNYVDVRLYNENGEDVSVYMSFKARKYGLSGGYNLDYFETKAFQYYQYEGPFYLRILGESHYHFKLNPVIEKVPGIKCKGRTNTSQKIVWEKVFGATGYQVQISNQKANKWADYANVKGNVYTFSKLESGNIYKFRVRAFYTANGKTFYSAWSKTLNSPTLPSGTTLTKLTPAKKAFTAQWKQNKTVNGYQVQYSLKSNFSASKTITVKSPKTLKAVAKKLNAGKYYYVRIRTYKTISKVNYFSAWSKTYKVKTK